MTTIISPPNAPRRAIAFGVILSAITTALMAAGQSVAMFSAFRFLGGLASALVLVYTTPIVFLRLAEMGADTSAAMSPLLDDALDLAERLAAAADEGRVDLGDLGRRARRLLENTVRPPEPEQLF